MQERPDDTSHDLLVKYLLGETTPDEVITVEQWLQVSDDNHRYFEQLKTIWTESRLLAPEKIMDENIAWQRFRDKQQNRQADAPVISITSKRNGWMKIAAMVLLIAGAGYLSWFIGRRLYGPRTVYAGDQVINYTLPDGSAVVLNKYASVSYPADFKGESRTVNLKGEAFFNVTTNSKKPFIVNVEDVQVQVVGTSFNVKNTSFQTEIVVETGIVDVSKNNNSVQVRQNEKAIVPKNGTVPEKIISSSRLYNYYRTNQFVCVETPLPELVAIINEAYRSNIKITGTNAAGARLTVTFQNKSLDQILEVIQETLNVSIERTKGEIIIK